MKRLSLILVIILIVSVLGSGLTSIAFAASETIYSDVLEDLNKDETFDVDNVKAEASEQGNPEMYVFQIAESNAGELFIYVYQQSESKYTASEIRISMSIGDNLAPKDYKLTLLSRDGVLHKYKVNDFKVLSDAVRYYVIVQIMRPYNNNTDKVTVDNEHLTGATTASNIVYNIGKLFTACTVDGNVTYTETHTDVITITDKYVGYVQYVNGFKWYTSKCDSHYVAFNTDKNIDTLYEADIEFIPIDYKKEIKLITGKESYIYKNPQAKRTLTLTNEDVAKNPVGLWGTQYTWSRIERSTDFIKNEDLTTEAQNIVTHKKWVLRFYESEFKSVPELNGNTMCTGTLVEDVTILRLKFESNGNVYNLGVVDNKQSETPAQKPDNNPDNITDRLQAILDKITDFFAWLGEHWWVIVVGVIVIVIIAALIAGIIKFGARVAFKVLCTVLWWILKIVFYIVTLPVWLIVWGIRAIKASKN